MVGVAFDTYIILQNTKQLILIDQHAAHERILYEKLMREIDAGVGSQVLMVAQVVHVTPQDAVKIESYHEEIRAAGFDIEPFGDDAYQIRAVPNVLGVPQTKSTFLEMVDRLGELRVLSTVQKRRDAILQMACKKSGKRRRQADNGRNQAFIGRYAPDECTADLSARASTGCCAGKNRN